MNTTMEEQPDRWDQVLDILSETIKYKNRADAGGWSSAFEQAKVFVQRLGLDEDLRKLKVVHVAGTKGKGSTCVMVDSMLRACGYCTALYTSPHLCDVRERIRINGDMVSKAVFARNFWWVHERLVAAVSEELRMPGYFIFITLLGLKVALDQGVDVAVLEVGLGGRLDATNVVPQPVVCGITSLGFDHMEILGHTLPQIAREKAGIMKAGSPAFTVPQPEDAMQALQECAGKAGVDLQLAPGLASFRQQGPLQLGLQGEHQVLNASLALQLAAAFDAHIGTAWEGPRAQQAAARAHMLLQQEVLPAEYARGLAAAHWPGRSHVIHDEEFAEDGSGGGEAGGSSSGGAAGPAGPRSSRLSFYLDGAHTPESMLSCGSWFADMVAGSSSSSVNSTAAGQQQQQQQQDEQQVLLFNCMKERDPAALLPALARTLASRGVAVQHAAFVPPDSNFGFLPGSSKASSSAAQPAERDLTWQQHQQQQWEAALQDVPAAAAGAATQRSAAQQAVAELAAQRLRLGGGAAAAGAASDSSRGVVSPSLQATVDWLRACVRARPQLRLQVLVTGSLYLVGDMLRLLGRAPQ